MDSLQLHLKWLLLMGVTSFCWTTATSTFADEPRAESYLFPARKVDPASLKSDDLVVITQTADCWSFVPARGGSTTALLFFPGGGVQPIAYAPLVRGVATKGFPVHLVKLSSQFANSDEHRRISIAKGNLILTARTEVKRWVVGGHSMGGAIAARFVHEEPKTFRGLVLIGTTHPRDFDLSGFPGDVTKIYGTQDYVARQAWSEANKKLLPAKTTWVRIDGANHSQFGWYGSQPGDGKATISREQQQQATTNALVQAIQRVSEIRE